MPFDLPVRIQTSVEQIRTDNTSGAVALTLRAAETMALLAADAGVTTAAGLLELLIEAARALANAQPAMAPILNLANTVLWRAGTATDLSRMQAEIGAACREFVHRLEASGGEVSRQASSLISDGVTVMTHSHSQTVLNALVAARQAGRQFEVICPESRPICEGTAMARHLGNAGIRVTLVVDAAMLSLLKRAQIVMAGADSVSDRGVVNKTGTSLLALAAGNRGTAFYVLCASDKILPAGYALPAEPPKPVSEITAESSPNVTVENFYFDLTPLDLVTGVVTEEGILAPEQLRQRQGKTQMHPALLSGTGR